MENRALFTRLPRNALLAANALVVLTGCVTTDTQQTKAQGTAIGALIGGLAGAAIDDKRGAIIGAIAGAAIGHAWGSHVASKKANYANQEAYLKDVIAAADAVAADAEAYNKRIARTIGRLKQRETELRLAAAKHQAQQHQLKKFEAELQVAISETEKKLKIVMDEIKIQKRVVANEQRSAPPRLMTVAAGGISDLEIQQRALQRALTQLESIDERRAY